VTPILYLGLYVSLLAVHLFSFRINDLYKRHIVVSRYRQFILVVKSVAVATVMIALPVAFASFPYFSVEGKDFFLDYFVIALALFTVLRVIPVKPVFRYLARQKIYRSSLLIVGGGDTARHVAASLESDDTKSFEIVGFLDDYRAVGAPIYEDYVNLGSLEELDATVQRFKVSEILIAIDDAPYERLIHIVDSCLKTGKVVRIYSNLLDVVAKKMHVEFYGAVPVIMLSQHSGHNPYLHVKRVIDVVLSAIGLVLLAPVFLVIAIGIKLSSRGPVFFHQERIGQGGAPFSFIKFRSMHVGSDDSNHKEYVTGLISESRSAKKAEKSEKDEIKIFKITSDPRIFGFGKFIRETSLDEFPQFYNVLRGEMSLVGPRPCLHYEWDCYDEWHKNRLQILPGCTGLWQALGRSSVTFEDMVILDLYYISNMSLWLDLRIVLQTFPVIFLGKGAY